MPNWKYLEETLREVAAIPFLAAAKRLYEIGNRIAPEPELPDPGDGYPEHWQDESPEVTKWRSQRAGKPPMRDDLRPDAGEATCAAEVPLDRE